ncbi:MAG: DUF362 domain-containing protein [Deltaproteobacteria bacterium]|nr:MAG: DUF362 domain-containing protein [Deltaproteobacteria bacterium]
MISYTKEERHLKILMRLSAITYFVVGFAFAFLPEPILRVINLFSRILVPGLEGMPLSVEKFWLSMTFSMMMTIGALSYIAQHNVRKNGGYVIPVLISKAASSLSAFCFFIFSARYFAYLVIFIVDGSIFWITLFFFIRAKKGFFRTQTAYLRKEPVVHKSTAPTTVVALKGEDKFDVLSKVLEKSGFFEILDRRLQDTGKPKEDFSVVIKPNFMFMHSKKDISTYTDPELVEALVDTIVERGFPNISLVESQSTYGNYYNNREVIKVSEYIGYSTTKNYRIVDLTEEMVPYDYGGRLGQHFVGPTWKDADFRISFAKNKTHVFCNYTLTLKNIYGTLPMQNKLKEYHTKREYDWPTIETMKHFPVHFGLIDAISSGDGPLGVITDPKPNNTKTIIGGENLIAVDWVGAKKMGIDPDDPGVGRFLQLAVEAFGRPEIDWVGDKSVYDPWENVSEAFIKSLDIIEEAYAIRDWWFSSLTAMDEYFSFKKKALPILALRWLLTPIKRIFFRYDYLP